MARSALQILLTDRNVVAEPLFQRHAMLVGTEIARTIVQVSYSQPSSYPGSRAVVPTTVEVAVSVPLAHPDAAKLLRPGNKVVIEGGIDSVIVSQLGNETAAAKIEQLDHTWSERRSSIAPDEFDKELWAYPAQGQVLAGQTADRGLEDAALAA